MKNFTVKINTNTRPFQEKDMQTVGTVQAKNKAEAVEAVYSSFWGAENGASIITEMSGLIGPKSKTRLVAEID